MKSSKGTALITGASAGIGAALAKQFADQGHDLILVARNESKLLSLAAELGSQHGCQVTVIAHDLSVPGAAEALYQDICGRRLEVDILVNNAGILFNGPFTCQRQLKTAPFMFVNANVKLTPSDRLSCF